MTGSDDITVLLVDDSKTIRRSAASFLSAAGHSVITASDGFEALAKVVEYRPTVIFVDIMMPRLDGYQTCALIKNNADYRDIPVIMLSSKDGLFDKARGRVVGSDAHLSKPFTEDTLLGAVRQYAGQLATSAPDTSAATVTAATSDPAAGEQNQTVQGEQSGSSDSPSSQGQSSRRKHPTEA